MTSKDEVTILTCLSPGASAIKKFHAKGDGGIEKTSFVAGYKFTHEKAGIDNIYDLEALVKKLSQQKTKFIIRGEVKEDAGPVIIRRFHGTDATIVEKARHWVALDLDKLEFPEHLDAVERPEELIQYLVKQLPSEFHEVTCVFKFSSSQNVPKKIGEVPEKKVSAHLFYMCDRPITGKEWEDIFKRAKTPVDLAVFRTIQPLFMASPAFAGLQDPLRVRAGLLRGTRDEVRVSEVTPRSPKAPAEPSRRTDGEASAEKHYAGRNDALFKETCRLRRLGYSEAILRALAHALNELSSPALHPNFKDGPMDGSEVEKIVQSAMKYDHRQADDGFLNPEDALALMNAKYAIVKESGNVLVISTEYDEALERTKLNRSSFSDIRNFHSELVLVGLSEKKQPILKSLGKWWLENPGALHYDRVVFRPGGDCAGAYNLWRGYGVEPKEGSCKLFHEHLLLNICQGNEKYYSYLLRWLARMIQQPGSQGEVAIVLRGGRGTGKGLFITLVGRLLGQHFFHISNSKHLTGNFNAHLQDVILLFCDEAFWAGDKQAESTIKTLITEKQILYEPKGVDPYLGPNYLHIMMASNSAWVVPAGLDERRYFVLDVGDARQQDLTYFGALKKEMEAGGYSALLHELLHMDISDFEVRAVPQTSALFEQKMRSLSPEHKWIYEKLYDGKMFPHDKGWHRDVCKRSLQEDYVVHCKNVGAAHRSAQTELGMMLNKLFPSLRTEKKPEAVYYVFPSLTECRKNFETVIRTPIEWPEESEDVRPEPPM